MKFRLNLGKGLIGLSIGISLGIFLAATCTYWFMRSTQDKHENVARGVLDDVIAIDSAFLNFKQTRITLRTLGIPAITPEQQQQTVMQIANSIAAVDEDLKKLHRDNLIEGEAELIAQIDHSWLQFKQMGRKIMEFHQQGTPASQVKLNRIFFRECPDAAADFMRSVDALRNFLTQKQKTWLSEAREVARINNERFFGIAIIGAVLGGILSTIYSVNLIRGQK
ncbi:MCP four helix bundle domain-containing protein [Bdellovibrio sp. NC01]|uniref:MCP four helix bundle domain-containing protein n=1 Tax=Bdellovibrio sp. NC01 TaxID=2220073 RepID=UPI001156D081|nr:MCP four helix bundle domain-containing protein [Bdellovibrio sp. NC01]QDK38612.1 hypothetical protein DOE51_13995 [Bdellovibrio sp. NC01]